MRKIDNKVAIVTGSTKGIGMQIAMHLKLDGYEVITNSRRINKENSKLNKTYNLDYFQCDVSLKNSAKKLVNYAIKNYGRLDVLVCNVGDSKSVSVGKENYDEWIRMFKANFLSTSNSIEASIPYLKNTRGRIICISSICGLEHIDGAPISYTVSKAALNAYVKSYSRYLAKAKISINAIVPGNINFKGSVWDKKIKKDPIKINKLIKKIVPVNKFGNTKEIAELVSFICTKNRDFFTGNLIVIDGGQTRSL